MNGKMASAVVDPAAIPVANAWYLLLYAWDLAKWADRWRSAAETAPSLLGLMARVLAEATEELLRTRLARSLHRCHREIPGVRGRIDFSRSLRRRSFDVGRTVCAFNEISVDSPKNRVIKGTLERLLRDERLAAGASTGQVEALRHRLFDIVQAMDGVSSMRVSVADVSTLQLGRNDAAYELPIAVCGLILGSEIPREADGDRALAALLRDQVRFSELFERFVRNFLRHTLKDAEVASEVLTWPDEAGSGFLPVMRTDVTVEWSEPPRRLVLDTKYYGSAVVSRYGSVDKFHSTHLYQLYAYLRTQEHRGAVYQGARGMLLYPTTSSALRERMRVQGHQIEIATVDLAKPWAEIEKELLQTVCGE